MGNWAKILSDKYYITAVPHYVIIDKKGGIIVNKANRDSLDYYIKSNL